MSEGKGGRGMVREEGREGGRRRGRIEREEISALHGEAFCHHAGDKQHRCTLCVVEHIQMCIHTMRKDIHSQNSNQQ